MNFDRFVDMAGVEGDLSMVEPLFFKASDYTDNALTNMGQKPELTSYDVCSAMSKAIGNGKVYGAQAPDPATKGCWRLYLRSRQARVEMLLHKELLLKGVKVPLFDTNPFVTRRVTTFDIREKVTIKYLPLSVSNEEVEKLFEEKKIPLATEIKYANARDGEGRLTEFRNGDRYCYVKGRINPLLPRNVTVAGMKCKVFHDGQYNRPCRACSSHGHKAGDIACPALSTEENTTTFKGHLCLLSNFFGFPLNVFGKSFKSVEQAYQWKKAHDVGKKALAEDILNAAHAGEAKKLSKQIPEVMSSAWEEKSRAVMERLVAAKLKQCDGFKAALMDSKELIAEATPDRVWGSGLTSENTRRTKPEFWPGRNLMGEILMRFKKDLSHTSRQAEPGTSTGSGSLEDGEIPESADTTTMNDDDHDGWQTDVSVEPTSQNSTLDAKGTRRRNLHKPKSRKASTTTAKGISTGGHVISKYFVRSRRNKRKPSGSPNTGNQQSLRPRLSISSTDSQNPFQEALETQSDRTTGTDGNAGAE